MKLIKTLTVCAAAVLLCGTQQLSAEEARLLRFPATNSRDVVFSYAGDLYKVSCNGGKAVRLTSHVGYEVFARFSPDGDKIAFTGEYDGNREVYLMDAEGGSPVRLTYTSTNHRDDMGDRMGPNNIVLTWTPDGKGIMFRNRIGSTFYGKLWTVPVDGAMPEEFPLPEGGFCSWSPDGKKLAYNRVMREFRTWKYYRGGMADDVWIYDPKAKKVENITSNDAQDIFPMWVGDEIYFASDRDMVMNIFVYNTKTKQTSKVTDYKDYDVKFPSTDGKTIVFEHAGYICVLDPATKKVQQLHIEISSDDVYARGGLRDVSSKITGRSIPANGGRMVVTARGEVFDVPVGPGVVRNLTRTPGANDRGAQWSPDGKWIAYISDLGGETEVWLQAAEGGAPVQLTKGNDTYIRRLQWSPDSRTIIYTDRKNRLVELTPEGAKRVLLQNPASEFGQIAFSPDSKWIAYTKPAPNNMSVVYVCRLSDCKEYAVTEDWYDSSSPVFSTDGKYIIFNAMRDLNPIYSRVEWNYAYTEMGGVYLAVLAKDGKSPLLPVDAVLPSSESKAPADAKESKGAKGGKDAKAADKSADKSADKAAPTVVFDPEGIVDRTIKLPLSEGSARAYYCDGKKIWFNGRGGTKVYDFATGKEDNCCDARFVMNMGAKKAIFSKGKDVYVADFPAAKVALHDKVDLSGLKAVVDYSQEWPQVFDEVWRAFRDGYYLENFHGRDWKAIKAKYECLVPYAKTRLDLNYIIGEMVSEVATGHAYVNPGEVPKVEKIDMGLLGARLSADRSGYFKIEEILPGAPYEPSLRSPLSEPGLGVSEGEYITAIDGVSTKSVKNIYALLVGKANVLTELTVNSKAAEGGRKVVVKPISDEYPLYHYKWVQNNIKTVEEKTGGKVGYIYIPDMGAEGLNEFVRYFYPQLNKEALIIDDRANGGGNVSPMILERLQREVMSMTMRRGSDRVETVPDATHNGPKVVLVNKYSASDGDLFPWRFQAAGMGTVIGTRTWGGIVGITSSLPYMDGTQVSVPFFTNYDAKTGRWVVENRGVEPDILIDNDPVKEFAGIDEQLDKAIEVILQQLKDRKPLPGIPAPRTMKELGLDDLDDSQYLK